MQAKRKRRRELMPIASAWLCPLPEALPSDDSDASMIRLMEAQRRMVKDSRHWVGAFIERTTLERDGISQAIIHKWPDMIGQPLRPAGKGRKAESQWL